MNLSEKMTEWGILRKQMDFLEKEIQEEVIVLGKTQTVGVVTAKYRKSSTNGSYNWEYIVMELEPEQELVDKFTVQPPPKVDWKKIAEELKVEESLMKKHYTEPKEGVPTVTLQLAE